MAARRAWLCGLAGLLAAWAGLAAACQVERRASVPITQAGGLFLVPVAINGTVLDFVLDTGAERSVVGLQAAARLGLDRDPWVSTDMMGAGGWDQRRLGRPRSLSLGGLALRRHTVAADNSVVVGPVPDAVAGRPVGGLLGQDYLSLFDLDLDVAGGALGLYGVTGCSALVPPWPGPATAIAASRPVRNMLAVPVRIAGRAAQAELDTGASTSVVTAPGMLRLGLAAGGGDQVRGFGAGGVAARRQVFTLQVGPLPAAPATLLVSPLHTLRSIDMLLGADWVAGRRVWVSWATGQVFVPG